MNTILSLWTRFILLLGKIKWKQKTPLSSTDLEKVKILLKDNYYIILTRRSADLSTWAQYLAGIIKWKKAGYYSHAFMNIENEVHSEDDFRFIEAVGEGVKFSKFEEVFNKEVDSVVLLSPKNISLEEWTAILDNARTYLGVPYDSLFDLATNNAVSCVELVLDALKSTPTFETDFAKFIELIKDRGNLVPNMYYECEDFVHVFEARNGVSSFLRE